jgi:hypothetical protein
MTIVSPPDQSPSTTLNKWLRMPRLKALPRISPVAQVYRSSREQPPTADRELSQALLASTILPGCLLE